MKIGGSKMIQCVRGIVTKSYDTNSAPKIYMVEGKNLQVVLWCSHATICQHTHTQYTDT